MKHHSRVGAGIAALALATPAIALAHDGPKPDGHAPAGVMVDHMHKGGEFMIGYRYNWAKQAGDTLNGIRKVTDDPILHNACQNPRAVGHEHCMMKQTGMTMQMHMLDIMYAPSDWLTLMLMPQWMDMDMKMDMVDGAHMGHGMHAGPHGHGTKGFGDTIFGALVKLAEQPGLNFHAGLMFSAPTGSADERNDSGKLTHYMMQLGSGTWDFLPSLTYTGRADRLSWGVQASAVIRMEDENDEGYRVGNVVQGTGWMAYRVTEWMSASLRVVHTHQARVSGFYPTGSGGSPPDFPANTGGNFCDLGIGINTVVVSGPLKGHRLGVEWLQPLKDNVNGYQQEREGALTVNWSKAF